MYAARQARRCSWGGLVAGRLWAAVRGRAAGRSGATVEVVCWASCSVGKCGGSVLAKHLCSVWGVLTSKCETEESRVPLHKGSLV